jgi:hypothetical protein
VRIGGLAAGTRLFHLFPQARVVPCSLPVYAVRRASVDNLTSLTEAFGVGWAEVCVCVCCVCVCVWGLRTA